MLSLALALSLFINFKASEKIEVDAAITDLTGTTWLLNESFTTMPNGVPFSSTDGYTIGYDIHFVSDANDSWDYYKIYFTDSDSFYAGIQYVSTHVWDLTSWISQNYRTIEIIDGEDVTDTELIAWLQSNATQQDAGYSITYEENGGTPQTDLTLQTNLPSTLPTPTKTGYNFVGWYLDEYFGTQAVAGETITSDVTLYAQWELDIYIVTYYDGEIEIIDEDITQYYSSYDYTLSLDLPGYSKLGYEFLGWYDNSSFSGDAITSIPINSTGNKTFYANLQYNGFSITYEENGGSSQIDLINQSNLPNPLPSPIRQYYSFGGWYYNSILTNQASTGDELTSDVILYAKWIQTHFSVTYQEYGGSSVIDLTYETNLPLTLPESTKPGYYLNGWFYDQGFTSSANAGDLLFSDVILYAEWLTAYTVYFSDNDLNHTILFSYVDIINLPDPLPTSSKTGYTFVNWLDIDDEIAVPGESLTGSITYYANWNINQYSITYMDGNIELELEPVLISIIEQITLPTPIKNDYHFIGWYDNSLFENEALTVLNQVDSNVILYAKFEPIIYHQITYMDGDVELDLEPTEIEDGLFGEIQVLVTKDGYNFGGWFLDSLFETSISNWIDISSDSILYAKWNIIVYIVTINGIEFNVNHGDLLSSLEFDEPVKDFYTFDKWVINSNPITDFDILVTSNLTIEPTWLLDVEVDLNFPLSEIDISIYDLDLLVNDYSYFNSKMGNAELIINGVTFEDFEFDIGEIGNSSIQKNIFFYYDLTVYIDDEEIIIEDLLKVIPYSDLTEPYFVGDLILYKNKSSVLLINEITTLIKPLARDLVDETVTVLLLNDGYTGFGNINGLYDIKYQLIDDDTNLMDLIIQVSVGSYGFDYYYNKKIYTTKLDYSRVQTIADLKNISFLPDLSLQYQMESSYFTTEELVIGDYPLTIAYTSTAGLSGNESVTIKLLSSPAFDIIEEDSISVVNKWFDLLLTVVFVVAGAVGLRFIVNLIIDIKHGRRKGRRL